MHVTINGKKEEVSEMTVMGLLQQKNIEPRMVSVELNTVLLDRAHLASTTLKEGDQIEFLYFMGGGGIGHGGQIASMGQGNVIPY